MNTLLQFGAGNIGRSFIGQLFARGGYEVVFVDVNPQVVEALNQKRRYRIEIRDDPPGEILVENVRAVDGRDVDAVVREIVSARVAGSAVGANALHHLYPTLAAGLAARWQAGKGPLDLILCENLHNAASFVTKGLREHLPEGFPIEEAVGLVETSIGKMVPLVPEEVRASNPLYVCAEAFNTLIVDASAFKNPIPSIPGLAPKLNMPAYVDRKLYVHNLGHAAVAYASAFHHPEIQTIGEAVRIPEVRALAEGAMRESAAALHLEYPQELTAADLEDHIQDLLRRFGNPALGDTIYRVGRDIRRKLSRHDRMIGALLMGIRHGLTPSCTTRVAALALRFRTPGESGQLDPADASFIDDDLPRGIEHVLSQVCGLDPDDPIDQQAWDLIINAAELA